jgi:regulator of RNase E activity RraB
MATKWIAKVSNGTYTDRSGKEKTSWLEIGRVIEKQNGSLSLKIDSIPVEWNGWVQFFDPPKADEKQGQTKLDEDVPF